MARTGLGMRVKKLIAAVGAVGAMFVLSYAVHVSHAPSKSGVVHAASALKTKQAENALEALLKNSKPSVSLIGKKGAGPTQARMPAGHLSTVKNVTVSGSFNWSGYVSAVPTAQEYTKVYGSWHIPKAYCTAEQRINSVWVGLDGWQNNSNTVEQAGTTSFCYEGSVFYFTWYEMYPANTVEVGSTAAAGDAITASVTRSGTSYTLKLTDSTNTANSFSTAATCALKTCLDNSAEWIVERPAYSIGVVPLADTNPVTMSGCGTIAAGVTYNISTSPSENEVEMFDATQAYQLNSIGAATGGTYLAKWVNSY